VLQVLETVGSVAHVRRGAAIYAEGAAAEHWYKVVSGAVRICKLLADGRRQVAEFALPGELFGFEARDEHGFAAEAIADASIVRYPRRRIEMLADADAGLAHDLRDMTFKGVTAAHDRLLLLDRKSGMERVAAFLVEMAERTDEDSLELPMTLQEVADYLGLAGDTVCRSLAVLKGAGIIDLPTPQSIVIVDRQALVDLHAAAATSR